MFRKCFKNHPILSTALDFLITKKIFLDFTERHQNIGLIEAPGDLLFQWYKKNITYVHITYMLNTFNSNVSFDEVCAYVRTLQDT
jgi:hypothetical protein